MAKKRLSREEAEEYTRNLGQAVVGDIGLMEFAMHTLNVPESLGVSNEEWVQKHLGGYRRWSADERRQLVGELSGEQSEGGRYERTAKQVAEILGIGVKTVEEDRQAFKAIDGGDAVPALDSGVEDSGDAVLTPDERRDEVAAMMDEGMTAAEIAVELDYGVSTISKDMTSIRKERKAKHEPSEKLRDAQDAKDDREKDQPGHERKESEARLEQFRQKQMENLAKMRGPLGYIESAIEEVRWFVNESLDMEGEDEIVRRYIELGRELQVYGARHDIDTAALDEALAAITKE